MQNYYLGTFEMQASAWHTLRHIRSAQSQMDHTYGVSRDPWSNKTQEYADALRQIPEVADAYEKLAAAEEALKALHKLFGAKKGQYLADYLPEAVDKTA